MLSTTTISTSATFSSPQPPSSPSTKRINRRRSNIATRVSQFVFLILLSLSWLVYVVLHLNISDNNNDLSGVVRWKGGRGGRGSEQQQQQQEFDNRSLSHEDATADLMINNETIKKILPIGKDSPPTISDTEIRNLFYLWKDALETYDPDIVAKRYSKHASVLLPTGSNIPRTNYTLIREYFVDFLKKKPHCKILESYVFASTDASWCMDVGIYEFKMQTAQQQQQEIIIKARYTFVYIWENGEWKILHHHSSKMPVEEKIIEPLETESTETKLAVVVGGMDTIGGGRTQIVDPTTTTSASKKITIMNGNIGAEGQKNALNIIPNNNIIVGQTYNAKNTESCWLSPQWGSTTAAAAAATTNHNFEEKCLGSNISNPTTSAIQLTCIHHHDHHHNHDDDNNLLTQTTRSNDPTRLTIGLLYYMKPSQLLRQIEMIQSYDINIQRQLTLLIIDDSSPDGLTAYEYVRLLPKQIFEIRIARVLTNLEFNHGGARNLACYLSETSRIILLDLDLLIDDKMIQQLMNLPLVIQANADDSNMNTTASTASSSTGSSISVAHRFNRYLPPPFKDGIKTRLHPAVMLLNVSTYWQNGGCDEDFVGSYGFTDMHYWYKWRLDSSRKKVIDHSDIYLREFQIPGCNFTSLTKLRPSIDTILQVEGGGGSTPSESSIIVDKCTKALTKLKQSKPKRKPKINKEKLTTKKETGCWSNRYLRFPWKLIL